VDPTIGLTILSSPLLALETRDVYGCSLREIRAWVQQSGVPVGYFCARHAPRPCSLSSSR